MLGILPAFFDMLLHLDTYLSQLIQEYGIVTYAILFAIIFLETGIVITPFLPGDSLLFAAGTFAALGVLDVSVLCGVLALAAIAGDTVNYHIGKFSGPKVFRKDTGWLLNKNHLEKTQRFYAAHGGKTIVLARFMPIIRTFAPFVAGMGRMVYMRFLGYNIAGAVVWVALFVFGGYFFGNIPFVRENFTLVILAIIALSFLPGVVGFIRQRYKVQKTFQ